MKLLDFPQLHCPRCAAKYDFAGLAGHGTLMAHHPANACMDDGKEVRVQAKEVDVDWPAADVQQAQVAFDFNEQMAKAKALGVPPVPTGYVPNRVKVSESVKPERYTGERFFTDTGREIKPHPDGWYYA